MITDRLPLDVATTLLELSGSDRSWCGYTPVHDEQTDTRRWVSAHRLIVRRDSDDTLWELHYERPLTEAQECDLFPGGDPVTAYRVVARERVVIEYVTAKDGDVR